MKIKLLFTISFLFFINSLLAQEAKFLISGVVKDADTGETLPSANVFLTGTTIGTTTGKDGGFNIKVYEQGTYELIVKFVGYETFARKVEFFNPEDLSFEILLNPEKLFLGSVTVTDERDEEWLRNLESFKRTFLGLTKNAKKTKILNEEEINFFYNAETRQLEAYCDGPIKIKNEALGYYIDYYLEDFIIDYNYNYSRFFGFTQFKEIKENNPTKKKFQKARNKAYFGSVQHFFKALYANELKNEGWNVMLAEDVTNFGRVVKAVDYDVYQVLTPGENELAKALTFEGYLYMTYTQEKESSEFTGQANNNFDSQALPQRSWIFLSEEEGSIHFESNGYLLNPISFVSNGYWGFEKMAEMLPVEFKPYSR